MTSANLSKALKTMGISYSPSAVRKAWAAGAPRTNADDFAGWLVLRSRSSTAAVRAAEDVTGISREESGALSVDSAQHALALLVDLWRPHGVAFYLASNALLWQTITRPIAPGANIADLEGAKFIGAMMQALPHLRVAFGELMPLVGRLGAAGFEGESRPWVKASQSLDGLNVLNETAKQHFARFAAMPE